MQCDTTQRAVTRPDALWHDPMCCDVTRCDVMWPDVMWCDMTWCDVTWPDVMWPNNSAIGLGIGKQGPRVGLSNRKQSAVVHAAIQPALQHQHLRSATSTQAVLLQASHLQRAWLVHSWLTPYRSLKTGTISLHLIACHPMSGKYQLHVTICTHKGNLAGLGVPIRHQRLLHCHPLTGRTRSTNSSLWLCIVWYTHRLCQPNDAVTIPSFPCTCGCWAPGTLFSFLLCGRCEPEYTDTRFSLVTLTDAMRSLDVSLCCAWPVTLASRDLGYPRVTCHRPAYLLSVVMLMFSRICLLLIFGDGDSS